MMTNEFEYKLLDPLEKVGINGNFITADRLILRAPSKKLGQYTAKIKQGIKQSEIYMQSQVLSAIKDVNAFLDKSRIEEISEIEESDDKKSQTIITRIMGSNVNWHDFEENFKQLCLNGCCLFDEKHPMTSALFDNLSDRDGDNMLGMYIVKFFL